MRTITMYPRQQPSLDDVIAFVRSVPDGDWVTGAQISRGVIESDDGRVYLAYDDHFDDYFAKYVDDDERTKLVAQLGFAPTVALHLQVSSAFQHSAELALTICHRLVEKWGGDYRH